MKQSSYPCHPDKARKQPSDPFPKPPWLRVKAPAGKVYLETKSRVDRAKLTTVCGEASCPNVGECWSKAHATFMLMGDVCTRGCAFCNVATGKPDSLDPFEPGRIAKAVLEMGLEHAVITSFDRDDLEDGGAEHYAKTIRVIKLHSLSTTVEVLTPEFRMGVPSTLKTVVLAGPDVFNHNVETVPRLCASVRPSARYFHSLRLQKSKGISAKYGDQIRIDGGDGRVV